MNKNISFNILNKSLISPFQFMPFLFTYHEDNNQDYSLEVNDFMITYNSSKLNNEYLAYNLNYIIYKSLLMSAFENNEINLFKNISSAKKRVIYNICINAMIRVYNTSIISINIPEYSKFGPGLLLMNEVIDIVNSLDDQSFNELLIKTYDNDISLVPINISLSCKQQLLNYFYDSINNKKFTKYNEERFISSLFNNIDKANDFDIGYNIFGIKLSDLENISKDIFNIFIKNHLPNDPIETYKKLYILQTNSTLFNWTT